MMIRSRKVHWALLNPSTTVSATRVGAPGTGKATGAGIGHVPVCQCEASRERCMRYQYVLSCSQHLRGASLAASGDPNMHRGYRRRLAVTPSLTRAPEEPLQSP